MKHASLADAGGWAVGRIDDRLVWTLGFAAVLAFYLATTPENRTEAIDGYGYAYDTKVRALTDLFDTRHLLFLVLMRLLYRGAHAIYGGVTAHGVLLAASALSASLCLVLFARLLNRHFGLSLATSLLGAGFLGATYGFWRYSVEAEVYAPSLFLIMAVLSLVFAAEDRAGEARRWTTLILAGVLAGLAVLFYQGNAIVLFLALPILFLRRGGFPRLMAYGAVGGSVVLVGYVVAFLVDEGRPLTAGALYTFAFHGTFVFERAEAFWSDEGPLTVIAMSIVALGQTIVSGTWVLGLQHAAAAVNEAMPLPLSGKRAFAASKAGVLLVYLPLFTLAALVAVGAYAILIAVQARRRPMLDRRVVFALSWFGLNALVNGRLAPWEPEVWIITLPPLVILFAAFVIEPCVRTGRRVVPALLLATLALHNAIGGIGIVYGASGDYYRAKAAWVLANATTDDLIMLPVGGGFQRFLCYVGGLRVVTTSEGELCLGNERRDVARLIETTRRSGGRIFVFDDFFSPPVILRGRKADPDALAWAEHFRGTEQPVFRSDAGTTYRLP